MQLHRASSKPEWELCVPAKRNYWQKIAARTNGIATPANMVTVMSFLVVLAGLGMLLANHYAQAAPVVIIGRLGDLLDGWLAEKTGTKSPLGEVLDASVDKITVVLALAAVVITGMISAWFAVALLLPQAMIAVLSLQAGKRSVRLHPSRAGKVSMALVWLALFIQLIIAWRSLENNFAAVLTGGIISLISILLGYSAALAYARELNVR